jgi:hypothetical protein
MALVIVKFVFQNRLSMKFVLFLLTLLSFTAFSQQVRQLQFREETHDFGVVAENKGPVMHEFVFTNSSPRPVSIINVQASCGCTTPGWSKDPIQPGKTGFIQASFDPRGRPGAFNKTLTVTTDLEGGAIVLQIKGQVSTDTDEHVDPTGFEVRKGSISLKTATFNMGKVFFKDELTVKQFPIINSGTSAVTFDPQVTSPPYIRAEVIPATLAAGAKGVIKLSYNGQQKGKYGYQTDNIEFKTDDADEPLKSFAVLATVEDYFPQQSEAELAKSPKLYVANYSVDLGRVRPNTEVVRDVAISNTGKKVLDIRSVQGNCSCISASAEKTSLKPGESSILKVSFDARDRKGSQQKSVTLYTNDPRNPVQRITFSAYIE